MAKRPLRAFTLIELMIVVAVIGLLSVIAGTNFARYIRRAKTSEAMMNIRRMFDGAMAYWSTDHPDGNGAILPKYFPDSAGDTPSENSCCGNPSNRCPPAHPGWAAPGWQVINFSMDHAHFYWYRTRQVTGDGRAVNDRFDVVARGNLNCDNRYSTFLRPLIIDSNYAATGVAAVVITDDLE